MSFKLIKKLGKGGEGSVFEVKNNFDMQHYAIKRISNKIFYITILILILLFDNYNKKNNYSNTKIKPN